MAGGIFGDRPFVLNPKCILFALICMALFLVRPTFGHPAVAFAALMAVFWAAYIAMAWYDYYFNCDIEPLRKGTLSAQGLLKPPAHVPEAQHRPMDTSRHMTVIYLLHIAVIVPLIGYIAIRGKRTPPAAFWLLGAIATFTLGYHSIGAYTTFATSM